MKRQPYCTFVLLCILAGFVAVGCSALSLGDRREDADPAAPADEDHVRLIYRTPADRINLMMAGDLSDESELIGDAPAATNCVLTITYPHPHDRFGFAQAAVGFVPLDDDEALPQQVRLLDLPAGQLAAVVKKLHDDRFFRRSRRLNTEAHLTVETRGSQFGKKYPAVAELDAAILRTLRRGDSPQQAEVRRLPPVRNG